MIVHNRNTGKFIIEMETFIGDSLSGVDISKSDLAGANLAGANLTGANLAGANLAGANLAGANLADANLTRANLDFASFHLWCGSKNMVIDDRIAKQLAMHVLNLIENKWPGGLTDEQKAWLNESHRVADGSFHKF